MALLAHDGQLLTVEEKWIQRPEKSTTYNFEVSNTHSYFVGEKSIWAHNACKTESVMLDYTRQGDLRINLGIPNRINQQITKITTDDEVRYVIDLLDEGDHRYITGKLFVSSRRYLGAGKKVVIEYRGMKSGALEESYINYVENATIESAAYSFRASPSPGYEPAIFEIEYFWGK